MSQWSDSFFTAQDCCDSMPWKDFGECLATPSPTGPPPPTSRPTARPTKGKPTSRPTEAPTTKKPTMAPTSVPTIDCSAFKWHMSTQPGESNTCTNDDQFPEPWLQNEQFFFHATGLECCQKTFGGNCDTKDWCGGINKVKIDEAAVKAEEAAIKDKENEIKEAEEAAIKDKENEANQSDDEGDQGTGSDFVKNDGGMDDFEGGGTIPWILGNPPEWKIEDTMAFSGTHSITNIPSTGLSAASTLTSKIDTSVALTLACKVYVDISMPFDRFSFHVNGVTRNVFYKPEDNWITLTSGIAPGSNTIEFTVTNGDMDPGFDRGNVLYGTGRVWVDSCNIV